MKRSIAFLALLAACGRAESGAPASGAADSQPASAGVPVAFRLPARGGIVTVYRLPSLEPVKWNAGRVSSPRSAVGVDLVGRRLVFRDSAGALVSYDLVASRERVVAPRGSLAALASDGTVLAVDSTGGVIESQPWGSRSWSGSLGRGVLAAFATPGPRLIVVRRAGGDSLAIATREAGIAASHVVPAASGVAARTASRDGDAVAIAVDSGVVVVEAGELEQPWFVRVSGKPTAVVFSPSGHRMYLALAERNAIAVVDRFARRARGTIDLPEAAQAMRVDPWGRVLLVRGPGEGDEMRTWVVSLAQGSVSGELATRWGTDLPSVSEEGVLLVREGDGLAARDVRTLDSLGMLAEGGNDVWFAGRGTPPPVTAGLRAAAADSARRSTRPRLAPATAGVSYWVQISVSRNEAWARSLAEELNAASQRVQVVAPRDSSDGWRVMTGPYTTRESADSAGRALGRPYWVVEREAAGPAPR